MMLDRELTDLVTAAERLGLSQRALAGLIDGAVEEAERPTASQCTLPGPAFSVRISVAGRLYTAQREDDGATVPATPWRLLLGPPPAG